MNVFKKTRVFPRDDTIAHKRTEFERELDEKPEDGYLVAWFQGEPLPGDGTGCPPAYDWRGHYTPDVMNGEEPIATREEAELLVARIEAKAENAPNVHGVRVVSLTHHEVA